MIMINIVFYEHRLHYLHRHSIPPFLVHALAVDHDHVYIMHKTDTSLASSPAKTLQDPQSCRACNIKLGEGGTKRSVIVFVLHVFRYIAKQPSSSRQSSLTFLRGIPRREMQRST